MIALTANTISGAREMFRSEGFTEFIPKPIERAVLERVPASPDKNLRRRRSNQAPSANRIRPGPDEQTAGRYPDLGREALEGCGRIAYDIVFLDHMMPGFDGVETLKRLREINDGIDNRKSKERLADDLQPATVV